MCILMSFQERWKLGHDAHEDTFPPKRKLLMLDEIENIILLIDHILSVAALSSPFAAFSLLSYST